jgi:uncharacterized heparinase superfamily protein
MARPPAAEGMPDPLAYLRRLHDGARRVAFSSPLYAAALGQHGPKSLAMVPPDPWPGDAERGAAIAAGRFQLGGHALEGDPAPWEPFGAAPSFLEALHAFDWLRDLRAAGGDQARRQTRRLVADWIDRYDRWHPLIWRADLLGLRIANWLGAHDFYCASADDTFRRRVFRSLARQVRHLTRVAAGDPLDPRQIPALKGLVYGAVVLPHGGPRLDLARRLLSACLPRQILPDGGHIQRNPTVQLVMLRHLVDMRAALRAAGQDVPDALGHAIERMAPALRLFRHGDGGLALFNGSEEGEPVLLDTVLAQADAKGRPLKSTRHAGFERLVAGRTLILVDVGPPPPPGLDRDCHAGLFSFEMSVGRERLIVNCGAWHGRGGIENEAWHAALRGTPAHATLCVAGRDTLAFRPGDGGVQERPSDIVIDREDTAASLRLDGQHDGYYASFGLFHRRTFVLAAAGDDLRGEDRLVPTDDRTHGEPFAVRFHLHPAVHVSPVQNGTSVLVRLPGGAGWRLRAAGGQLALEESIYVGRGLDRRRCTQAVIWGRVGPDGAVVQWSLQRERKAIA